MRTNNLIKNISLATLFSISMGFLESITVIYLRKIFYPEGFSFPLNIYISKSIIRIEIIREICTLVMLICISILIGKNLYTQIAYFLLSFGLWDIFYYIGLKILLNWPESLLTWDILFLIPIPWTAPVLAPIMVSIVFIIISLIIIYLSHITDTIKLNFKDYILILSGLSLIFVSFIWNYAKLFLPQKFIKNIYQSITDPELLKIISEYSPSNYNWYLLWLGLILILIPISYKFLTIKKQI